MAAYGREGRFGGVSDQDLISKAIRGYEVEIEQAREQLTKLRALQGGTNGASVRRGPGRPAKVKRTMSPEARKRISENMKRRWATRKGADVPSITAPDETVAEPTAAKTRGRRKKTAK